MGSLFEILFAFLACAGIWALILLALGLLNVPAQPQKTEPVIVLVPVTGQTARLEYTVRSLKWLRANGFDNMDIILAYRDAGEETMLIADRLRNDDGRLALCPLDCLIDEISDGWF